ncbi:DsbA family protein [Desulfovibrio legallii]|jgi:protein-disulfide isomerase|uniref:Protein-disulfide isomerase n=1 Tax=Desulfovibrio legallii TaxID=571438 RepID=A0A1G7L265_9BACT|nr:thioredoxin domain-containing protein [Desulfovibrio legallii]SDF43568.1 Protein-disulfide isomerase [Desulfovibrio legallii]
MQWLKSTALAAAVTAALLCGPTAEAAPLSDENLAQALEKIFQERPDLVMDVLRRNSESVLDIAQQGSNLRRKRSMEAQWAEDMKTPKSVRTADRPVLGPANAKVRIVAFSDFTCHFCQQASHTLDALLREYGKDVSLVFKNLPLDEKGPGAAAAGYFTAISLQSGDKAWAFYRAMFANRDQLVAEGEAFLKKTAEKLDVDMKRLSKDLHSKKVKTILTEDQEDAQKLGVEGTPYFLVNNMVVRGALPLDLFKDALDMALKNPAK